MRASARTQAHRGRAVRHPILDHFRRRRLLQGRAITTKYCLVRSGCRRKIVFAHPGTPEIVNHWGFRALYADLKIRAQEGVSHHAITPVDTQTTVLDNMPSTSFLHSQSKTLPKRSPFTARDYCTLPVQQSRPVFSVYRTERRPSTTCDLDKLCLPFQSWECSIVILPCPGMQAATAGTLGRNP